MAGKYFGPLLLAKKYVLKVSNIRKRCGICSKSIKKTPEGRDS